FENMKRLYILLALLVAAILATVFRPYLQISAAPFVRKFTKAKTVEQRLEQYGNAARARLKPYFDAAQINYPPPRVSLVGLKDESVLQIYATDAAGAYRFIRAYLI